MSDREAREEHFPEVYEMLHNEVCDELGESTVDVQVAKLEKEIDHLRTERDRLEADLAKCREQLQQNGRADDVDVGDQLVANIEDAHNAALRAQESNHVDAATIDDIVAYLERAQEAIDSA